MTIGSNSQNVGAPFAVITCTPVYHHLDKDERLLAYAIAQTQFSQSLNQRRARQAQRNMNDPNDKNTTPADDDADHSIDLDEILMEIDSSSSRYRHYTWTLQSTVLLLAAVPLLSYIFTASQLNYRCRVPECDRDNNADGDVVAGTADAFTPSWLLYAVPLLRTDGANGSETDSFSRCSRFVHTANRQSVACSAADFDRSQTESCTEYVFETNEVSIEREFNLMCDNDGEWKLALIGTLDYVASCLMLPVCAAMSDK